MKEVSTTKLQKVGLFIFINGISIAMTVFNARWFEDRSLEKDYSIFISVLISVISLVVFTFLYLLAKSTDCDIVTLCWPAGFCAALVLLLLFVEAIFATLWIGGFLLSIFSL